MNKKIKLGIIGLGYMGIAHARSVLDGKCPEFELTAVAVKHADKAEWAKRELSADVIYFESAQDMLDSGMIEACIIAVQHTLHVKYAIECMKRGIHVMVEKPAGVYAKEVCLMNDVAEKHPEVVFGIMFNQRTRPIYRKMYELVKSEAYGNIRRTNWIITDWYRPQSYYDSVTWRATWAGEGGGVLLNQCPHQLDLWQWICGMPKKVDAHVHFGKWHDIEVEDDVTAYVEYENGATGVLVTSTGDVCGTNRFEIQMDKAKIVAENDQLTLYEYAVSEPEFSKNNKSRSAFIPVNKKVIELEEQTNQHVDVLNAWSGAILRGEPLVADGSEGVQSLTISNAMHLSAWLNQEIELPLDDDLFYAELMKRVDASQKK